MLVVTTIENLFIIHHSGHGQQAGHTCIFHKSFLPGKIWRHIRRLAGQPAYALNNKQNHDVNAIMQKIMSEKDSEYVFSKELQKTYVLELLHFITRIYGIR